jgi:hypothetical protein
MVAGPAPAVGSVFAAPRVAATRWIWADPDPDRTVGEPPGCLDAPGARIATLAES